MIAREKQSKYKTPIVVGILAAVLLVTPLLLSDVETVWEYVFVRPPPLSSITAETFHFENYGPKNGLELYAALKKLFPAGSPKRYVDNILVDKNSSQRRNNVIGNKATFTYAKHAPILIAPMCGRQQWIVTVIYDNAERLIDLSVEGPCISSIFN
jgi:hypothetical protein